MRSVRVKLVALDGKVFAKLSSLESEDNFGTNFNKVSTAEKSNANLAPLTTSKSLTFPFP